MVDWGLALRNVKPANMTTIKLPGSGIIVNGDYRGEQLAPSADEFFRSVNDGSGCSRTASRHESRQASSALPLAVQ